MWTSEAELERTRDRLRLREQEACRACGKGLVRTMHVEGRSLDITVGIAPRCTPHVWIVNTMVSTDQSSGVLGEGGTRGGWFALGVA